MNRSQFRLGAALILALLFFFFGIRTSAEEEAPAYAVTQDGGEYRAENLLSGESIEDASLSDLFSRLPARLSAEFISVSADGLSLTNGERRFSGTLVLTDSLTADGGSLTLSRFSLSCKGENSALRVKSGNVTLFDSSVDAVGVGVLLDYSSEAVFCLESGEVRTSGERPALLNLFGSAGILGGTISSAYGIAIENAATLKLSGTPRLSGNGCDVSTSVPITLSGEAGVFSSQTLLRVRYLSDFAKGSMTEVFRSAQGVDLSRISLTDRFGASAPLTYFPTYRNADGSTYPETRFAAVYLPYTVTFSKESASPDARKYLFGEELTLPAAPEKPGYVFLGWYTDDGEALSSGWTVTEDLSASAKYALSAPSFSLSGVSFDYDGKEREIAFSALVHPLSEEGIFGFLWYRNGTPISSAPSVSVRSVSESGNYSCLITFSHGTETVSLRTPEIAVEISKALIAFPALTESNYTGSEQIPNVSASPYYSVVLSGGTHVGEYPYTLTLTDPENTAFEGCDLSTVKGVFRIVKAKNHLLFPLYAVDYYEGDKPPFSAVLRFGEASFSFSRSKDGVFTSDLPVMAGNYFVRVESAGDGDVLPFVSEAVSFTVKKDAVVGLLISSRPSYEGLTALLPFSAEGIVAFAEMESGKLRSVPADALTVSYQKGVVLHVGDRAATVSYAGYAQLIPISVAPKERDLSGFSFVDAVRTYDANYHNLTPTGDLPSSLSYTVTGGGTDAGSYKVTLTFAETDPDYAVPLPLTALLTVTPLALQVHFENLSFTYDGTPKCPTACAVTATGAIRTLTVLGKQTDAADGCLATAVSDDPNYTLLSPTCYFDVKKAKVDLCEVRFSASELTYTGEVQSVTLCNLPKGVSVLGYTDASFTDAGSYLASALLGFDENNYDCPKTFSSLVTVLPAVYDMSGVRLCGVTAVYDGALHYPTLLGDLPVGKDGSSPSYSFDRGILHAGDENTVLLTFSSLSKNYLSPAPMTATVKILPKPVTLSWSDFSFLYDGKPHAPRPFCSECLVTVKGEAVSAGEYLAEAVSENPDFTFTNPTAAFTVQKAQKAFLTLPSDLSCFESRLLSPTAAAKEGSVSFLYYSDADGRDPIEKPTAPGIYRFCAVVPESENYLECRSSLFRYEIRAVFPIALAISLTRSSFVAMTSLADADVHAELICNDGTARVLLLSELSMEGELLCKTDKITFRYEGLSATLPITVEKASYDLSGVAWQGSTQTYDGTPLAPTLVGLPDGVSCLSVPAFVNAGVYEIHPTFSYDAENCVPPEIPACSFVIEKQKIPAPDLSGVKIRGETLSRKLPEDGRYTAVYPPITRPGTYTAIFTLTDSANTEFEGVSGDTLSLSFSVKREISPSLILVTVLSAAVFGLFVYILIFRFYSPFSRFYALPESVSSFGRKNASLPPRRLVPEKLPSPEKAEPSAPCRLPMENLPRSVVSTARELLSIDSSHADLMISDSLAKSLVRRGIPEIFTVGRRRAEINVDTLGEFFEAGDRIDVNVLKERGLIPKDAGRLKVLGRGTLTKPLTVFADAFSPCAVKMIALTGGGCYKVKTKNEVQIFSIPRKK